MNVFNKILVVILLLLLLALCLLLALFPQQTLQAVQQGIGNAAAWLSNLQTQRPWLFSLGQIALAVLSVVIIVPMLWQEVRIRRPRAVRVMTESGSQAAVTTDSVARRLTWHLDQLADVISVTPIVTGSGKVVNVKLNVQTRPEIDVPMKTDEIVSVAKEVITERMGLQLGKIQVHIEHAPYTEGVA
jgi:hypothetical protein